MKCREIHHPLIPTLVLCNQRQNIKLHHLTDSKAFRTHPVWIIERKIGSCTHIRFPDTWIERTQGRIHIADRPYGRPGIPSKPCLVNDDRCRQIFNLLCFRLLKLGEPAPNICRIRFIHLPLALCGNRIEYNTGLSGTGNSGKYNNFFFWNFKRNIFQVILAQSLYDNAVLMRHICSPFLNFLFAV